MKVTWEEVEQAGLREPCIAAALTLYERGDVSADEALILMVVGLNKALIQSREKFIKHMRECPPTFFIRR
jgi:hypothetical protein